jgi:hypothetical protein
LHEDEKSLHVAAAGAGAILIDDDFAARLRVAGEAKEKKHGGKCNKKVDFQK